MDLRPYLALEDVWELEPPILYCRATFAIPTHVTTDPVSGLPVDSENLAGRRIRSTTARTTAQYLVVEITLDSAHHAWNWLINHRWADMVAYALPSMSSLLFERFDAPPVTLHAWDRAERWMLSQSQDLAIRLRRDGIGASTAEVANEVKKSRHYILGDSFGEHRMTYPRAQAYINADIDAAEARHLEFGGSTPPTTDQLEALAALVP